MTVVTTRYGQVSGDSSGGVERFLGIPYAASPTGPLRFAAPQPPPRWDGIRPCTAFGPTPPKPEYPAPFDSILPEPAIPGDDWLSLNVWTRDLTGRAPVMVWIHGGAFANGNSAVPMYDGQAFARDGVVFVSLNYRLGVDGFAYLPDAPAPANRGLLDQVAALAWVRDNIAGFGGDPANVTIFGESAGGMSVTTLLAMPRAAGLFSRVIAQSGSAQAGADVADAALVAGELGKALGVEATAAAIAGLSLDAIIAGQAAVRDAMAAAPDPGRFGPTIVSTSMAFQPVVDGDVLPVHPLAALRAGTGAGVPLLTGTNTEEFRLFFVPTGTAALVTDETLPAFLAALGIPAATAAVYQASRPEASAGDVLCALVTDSFFRNPAFAAASARAKAGGPAPTFLYEFAWPSPVLDIGAGHAIEIPFVFDNLGVDGAAAAIGTAPPASLARAMHAVWIRFAATGDPGWPAFDERYPVMVFGASSDDGRLMLDPRGHERQAWPAS